MHCACFVWHTQLTVHNMKTPNIHLVVFALGIITMLTACTKEQQDDLKLTSELQMQYNGLEFTVPPTTTTGEVEITVNLDGNALAQMLSANGYSLDQLQEFRFTNGTLHIDGQDTANYNALQSMSLQVSLGGGAPSTVASVDPVPDGVNHLELHMSGDNVAEILRNNNVQLIAKVVLDGLVPDSVHQKLDLGGHIIVKL